MRTPSRTEIAIQGILGILLAILLVDFFQALTATACSDPVPSRSCYPWAMTEGPMEGGGGWGYSSKATYLLSSAQMLVLLAAAAMAPFLVGSRRWGLLALAGILLVGCMVFRLESALFQ